LCRPFRLRWRGCTENAVRAREFAGREDGSVVDLAVEMDGNGRGYGVIHAARCSDLPDAMPLGGCEWRGDAEVLADDATGWDLVPGTWKFAPCAARKLAG